MLRQVLRQGIFILFAPRIASTPLQARKKIKRSSTEVEVLLVSIQTHVFQILVLKISLLFFKKQGKAVALPHSGEPVSKAAGAFCGEAGYDSFFSFFLQILSLCAYFSRFSIKISFW